jgi:ADP-heptose:LPS heptosyltransferase
MLRSLQGAHAIFSFVAAPDSSWVQNVKRLAPEARLFLIDPNPPAGAHLHSSQHMLNQLAHDPVVSTALTQMFKSIQDRGLGMTGAADGPVIIHPGAGATSKCWPLDRFVELARRLRDSGRRVRAIIGEVEAERWTPAQRNAFGDLAELCEPPTLMDLYTALSPASAMVGNDSGPTHLAGIMGVHTIALFGPTNSAIWRPMGPRVDVIQGDTLDAITVDQVVERWGAQAKG